MRPNTPSGAPARAQVLSQARDLYLSLAGGNVSRPVAAPERLVDEGEASFHQGDLARAASLFLCALSLRIDHPEAWLDLGVVLDAGGAGEQALACLRTAVALDPDYRDAQVALAVLLRQSGRRIEAASAARDWLERVPDDDEVRALLAEMGVDGPPPPVVLVQGQADEAAWLAVLAGRGLLARFVRADVLDVLADLRGSLVAATTEWLERVSPVALVSSDPSWQAAARLLGIPAGEAQQLDDLLARRLAAPPPRRAHAPLLSVMVPTCDRHRALLNLLDAVSLQDLDPSFAEVVVVDDGSSLPVASALGEQQRPYRLALLRQANAGPAAARNLALTRCTAPWVVIYNDDTLPASDNLRRHLVAQATTAPAVPEAARPWRPEAVLGTFDFPPERCDTLFMHLMQNSPRLFLYPWMRPGELHSWMYLFTCNLSLPRHALEAVGGFDAEHFRRAICEDTELGLRLERQLGLRVRFRPDIKATHDHDLDVDRYVRRAFLLGYYQHRIWELHGADEVMWASQGHDPRDERTWDKLRALVEAAQPDLDDLLSDARKLARSSVPDDPEERERIVLFFDRIVAYLLGYETRRGHIAARQGWGDDPSRTGCPPPNVPAPEPLERALTSVIVPNLNGWPHVRQAVESLRRTTEGPVELIVVDNGSTDASLAWLRRQPDLTLVELGENRGAPAARNAGLARARGETIVFCDNDVVFTPAWRRVLLWHMDRWPDVGMVAPMSDYVVGPQRVDDPPADDEDLDAWATAFHEARRGRHDYRGRLILLFLVVRRAVVDQIGGIDEAFGPWGFEDDDFTVRAATAGWRLRIAGDCFIRHLGSRTERPAGLDYGALLRTNWEKFKAKWGMDPTIPFGEPYDSRALARRHFDPALHRVPLPETVGGPLRLVALRPPVACEAPPAWQPADPISALLG